MAAAAAMMVPWCFGVITEDNRPARLMAWISGYDGCMCADCSRWLLRRAWLPETLCTKSDVWVCGTGRLARESRDAGLGTLGLLLGALTLIGPRLLQRPRAGACTGCGYDLSGMREGRCPECGRDQCSTR